MILTCDDCHLCCDLLLVEELHKPAHTPCEHLVEGQCGGGCCGLHEARGGPGQPESCAAFVCAWRSSQWLPEPFRWHKDLRPDRVGAVFGPIDEHNPFLIHLNIDPSRPDSWQNTIVREKIEDFVSRGVEVKMYIGDASTTFSLDSPTVKPSQR